MKAARRLRPRNPVAVAPLLKKGGVHAPTGKRASRARQKTEARRRLRDETSGE